MTHKRKIQYNKHSEPYFVFNSAQHFLKDIDIYTKTDNTCYTNAGYFGGFKVIGIDYTEPDDRIVLERC